MPFNQIWPGYQRPMDQTEIASFAYWDMTGPVDVEVVSRRPVESVAIRPTARGIRPQVDGRRITFCLASPEQITVEINGWHKALHLFASPPPAAVPNPRIPQVRYFGPTMPSAEPSSVTMRNCSVTGKPLPPSRLQGFDAQHGIRDVAIADLRMKLGGLCGACPRLRFTSAHTCGMSASRRRRT